MFDNPWDALLFFDYVVYGGFMAVCIVFIALMIHTEMKR